MLEKVKKSFKKKYAEAKSSLEDVLAEETEFFLNQDNKESDYIINKILNWHYKQQIKLVKELRTSPNEK